MWRTSAVAIVFLTGIGMAQAQVCEPLPGGALLCEEQGSYLFVDPADGSVVDVTQEVLSAIAEGAGAEANSIDTNSAGADRGTFEDRLSDFCSDGSCPSGLSSAIDGITGYIPSYQ